MMDGDEVTTESIVGLPIGQLFEGIEHRLDKRLDHQDQFLDRIDRRLEGTATKEDLQRVVDRVDGIDGRVVVLETTSMTKEAVGGHKRRTWAIIGSIAGIVAVLGAGLITALVH